MQHPVKPKELFVDVRALQDSNFRNRGIGRLAENILLGIPEARSAFASIVGLVDPSLPDLDEGIVSLFDRLSHRVNPSNIPGSALLQLSPMTHSALPLARVLDDSRAFKAAIVYDFIPLESPERYLPQPASRVSYRLLLAWLAKYHVYFPISSHVKTALQTQLPVSNSRVFLTKGPVGERFLNRDSVPQSSATYILVPGGEPRKNVSLAIKAHASSRVLQDAKCTLLLLSEADARLHDYRNLSKELGGDPSLVSIARGVTEAALVGLFQSASLVVVPSKSEGFSLPVVEAMAAAAPIIASDIPAHRELVDGPQDLFPVEDSEALRLLMEERFQSRGSVAEADVLARRHQFAAAYTGLNIRREFWRNLTDAASSYLGGIASFSINRSRPRLAFVSPMPPTPSGIARYSAATVEALESYADVTVFVDGENPAIGVRRGERPVSLVPFIGSGYDRVIAAIGNSTAFHSRTMDALSQNSASIIAHDSRMLGYYLGRFGASYTSRLASEELGRIVSEEEILLWNDHEDRNEVTLFKSLVEAGDPLLVHSATLRGLIANRYAADVSYVPFASDRAWDASKSTPDFQSHTKLQLGFSSDDILVSSFGYVHKSKLPFHCIRAVLEARKTDRRIRLAFIGKVLDPDLYHFARQHDPDGRWIRFVDEYVDDNQYSNFLFATDIGIQLRTHGWGSVSAALMDCVVSGIPAVATSDLADAIAAPPFVLRVDEPPTVEDLSAAILSQCGHRYSESVLRQSQDFARERSFRNYAATLLQSLHIDVPVNRP